VQYLKRFYLTNSVITYNAGDIVLTAIYFATKTENHYTKLVDYAAAIQKKSAAKKQVTPERILASEFLLTQGLRFMFDIRHPSRALSGAVMELEAMAKYDISAFPGAGAASMKPENLLERLPVAAGRAKEFLKAPALITDVYFHNTPSQIMLASLYLADPDLTDWYLATKFDLNEATAKAVFGKVHATVVSCSEMMRAYDPDFQSPPYLNVKLKNCRNPDKVDLVGLQRAKREGDDGKDEKVVKKRKLERQQSAKEGEDLFGPTLVKQV
jgi:cyclin H